MFGFSQQLPFAQGIYKNNLDQMLEEINSNKRYTTQTKVMNVTFLNLCIN